MRRDLCDIVCCPADRARLVLQVREEDAQGEITTGTFTCQKCGFAYPIEDGIPNLLPPEYHVDGPKEPRPVRKRRAPDA